VDTHLLQDVVQAQFGHSCALDGGDEFVQVNHSRVVGIDFCESSLDFFFSSLQAKEGPGLSELPHVQLLIAGAVEFVVSIGQVLDDLSIRENVSGINAGNTVQ